MNPITLTGGDGTVDWCVVTRPLAGQEHSGDAFMIADFEGGTLLCAIDGLGHGEEAARAAGVAKDVIGANSGIPLVELVEFCHEGLKKTRGIVASFARFEPSADCMSWLGVGNVEAILFHGEPEGRPKREGLALRGGVIGYTLPPLHCASLAVSPGDLLVMATDGVAGAFMDNVDVAASLPEMAENIMEAYGKDGDDALVLVARYLGGEAR